MQVLNNLIGNATKFTENGTIVVEVNEVFKDNNNIVLEFCVEDSGIGISEENIKKLFNAFEQGDNSNTRKYGGTGLGLMICKQIITLMHGEISVSSKLGVGTKLTFTIKIEYVDGLQQVEVDKKRIKNKKFLVVDDNDIEREYLRSILKSWNLSVKTASGGLEAYELISKQEFDYVLLDWKMPNVDGLELISLLRKNNKELPAILMVTSHRKKELKKIASLQSISLEKILQKPFTPSTLYNTVFEKEFDNFLISDDIYTIKTEGKVLLVEDNETNQIVASKNLKKYGFEVDIASNGLEACTMAEDKKYDIIFMDLQMPIMDGFEATKKIREKNKDIPIIALSAAVMQKDKELTHSIGMNEHLAKPIELKKLEKLISKYFKVEKVLKDVKKIKEEKSNNSLSIYGLDIKKTVEFLGLEEEDILKMLERFSKTYFNIKKDLKDIDKESMEFSSYIHKLRGVSGNLQINEVYSLSSYIEENSSSLNIDEKINNLIIEVQKSCESINHKVLPLLKKEKVILKNEELHESIDSIIYDLENYNFIKKDRIIDIYNYFEEKLKQTSHFVLLEKMIKSFENNEYEQLEEILKKLKGKASE